MKHIILGTAGHVDHGKTALVQALTGIDCDTHKEEKLRGITINLGFAHLRLPSGDTVGIVDVPGHRDFVHTMVGGACGIDFCMLVIAADEGIMPQTREHLQIMEILGIRSGIIVLTKKDLVDDTGIAAVSATIRDCVKDSFLRSAEIVPVSARTGDGIETLINAIDASARTLGPRGSGELFRMYIDRIFSVSGFGTVVTGSVLGGTVARDAAVYLLPGGKELRVRRIERYGQQVETATAGDRASLNLVGLDKNDFQRGMLVAGRILNGTAMLDANIRLFSNAGPLDIWSQAVFLLGTFEAQARIHLIDNSGLAAGSSGLAQLHLSAECVAQPGDRFVLRTSSSEYTLGGGEIIDAHPLHHRRRTSQVIEHMSRIAQGKLPELIALEVHKRHGPVSHVALADALNVSPQEVERVLRQGRPGDIEMYPAGAVLFAIAPDVDANYRRSIAERIAAHHRNRPVDETGLSADELLGGLKLLKTGDHESFIKALLENLEKQGTLKRVKHTWALASHSPGIPGHLRPSVDAIEKMLLRSGMQVPLMNEIAAASQKQGISEKDLRQVLLYLVKSKRAYVAEDSYLHASIVDSCRAALLQALSHAPGGMTVAQFRDLVKGNRKICLILLSIYDAEGSTERRGDVRVITERGRALLR
jgi:selenocysteine-specific elongation factor